jgi:uncharacterized membrane protein
LVYGWTGSLAAAAVAATIGSSVGYYLPAYINAVRWSASAAPGRRASLSHLLALRSLAVEFGPAELVDSLVMRPILIYAGPVMLNHVVLGWIVGGVLADITFYVCAICSYERFKSLLAVRRPRLKGIQPEPVDAVAPA